jgi:hypothetical protein
MSTQIIAAEFRGLARQWRRQVDAADIAYIADLKRISNQMQARLARKPVLRPGMLIDIERAIRTLSHPYRLAVNITNPQKGHISITDYVVGSSHDRESSWGADAEWEKTVVVLRLDLSTSKVGVDIKTTPLASISGHAIVRWYERSGSRDPVMLLCDIAYILFAKEPDRVATPTGAWLGPVVNGYVKVNDENRRMIIRTARTYIHADMLEPIRAAKLEAVA